MIAQDSFQTDATSIQHKVLEVVHGNRSDNYCNWSDTQPSILLDLYYCTRLANYILCSLPYLEKTYKYTHTPIHTHSLSHSLLFSSSSSSFFVCDFFVKKLGAV